MSMDELTKLRWELDAIDQQLIQLFEQRMAISTHMSARHGHSLAAAPDRREAMLRDKSLAAYVDKLFETIVDLSCLWQEERGLAAE